MNNFDCGPPRVCCPFIINLCCLCWLSLHRNKLYIALSCKVEMNDKSALVCVLSGRNFIHQEKTFKKVPEK